jgi:N-acetylmuramidase-like protein
MAERFVGSAEPLTAGSFAAAGSKLGVEPAIVWAVISVETAGKGFLPDKRPELLFERHIFPLRQALGRKKSSQM